MLINALMDMEQMKRPRLANLVIAYVANVLPELSAQPVILEPTSMKEFARRPALTVTTPILRLRLVMFAMITNTIINV